MLPISSYWRELRATLKLGVPLVVTQLLGYSQQVVDTVMAGRHDALTLAAVSLAGQIFAFVYLLMVGMGVALAAAISHAHGQNARKVIRRHFQQGVWLMLLLGVVTMLLLLGGAYIPDMIGSEPNIAREAKKYLFALSFGGGMFVVALAFRYFLEGMAYPRTNIVVQIVLLPLNVVLNWAFLTGWWIFPALGAQGMAIATAICYVIYALFLFANIKYDANWRHLRLFKHFALPDWQALWRMFKIGVPISLAIIMEAALFISVSLIVSRENVVIAGANQIALNYASMMFMIPLGLAAALTVRIANASGAGNRQALRQRAIGGMIFAGSLMSISALVMTLFAREIAMLYSDNPEVIAISAGILAVIAIFQVFDGIQVCASGVLRGLQDTKIAMIYAFIGYWVIGFPMGIFCAYYLNYGIRGLWAGVVCGLVVNAILGTRRVLLQTKIAL